MSEGVECTEVKIIFVRLTRVAKISMWADVSVISAVFNLFKALYKIRHYNAYLDIFNGPGKWRGPRQLSDGGLINNWWVRVSPARSALSPNNGLDLAVGRPSGGY